MVSIDSVPSEFEVLTKPLEVRLEMRERFMMLVPEKVFESESRVDEANVHVEVE